jgi:DNA-binding IclR family transcriptional regulator
MRDYVTGGDLSRLGPGPAVMILALSALANPDTGEIVGQGVTELSKWAGFTRKATMTALSVLIDNGYLERLDDQVRGRRAVYRLRHRVAVKSSGKVVGIAEWAYQPHATRARHSEVVAALRAAEPQTRARDAGITLLLVQQIAPGGIGIIKIDKSE